MKIWLIEALWYDPLENRNAYGWDVIGYVETEAEAEAICTSEYISKSTSPWPLNYLTGFVHTQMIPIYRARPVEKFRKGGSGDTIP